MKIVFLIKHFNNASGGAEKVLALLANSLLRKGHEVTIACFDQGSPVPFFELEPQVKVVGLGAHCASGKTTAFEAVKRVVTLRRFLRRDSPDIVVGFMISAMVVAALAILGTGIRFIGSEHIGREHYRRNLPQFLTLLFSMLLSYRTSVLSDSIRNSYPRFIRRKLVPISNPVPRPKTFRKSAGNRTKIVVNVARLEPQKNHDTLLKAWKRITSQCPGWELHIYGEGSLRQSLTAMIEKLEISDTVLLAGATGDVEKVLSGADLFVFPSRYESFGLSLAEALGVGLPAIGFAGVEGVNDLIRDGHNGVLVDADVESHDALGSAMRSLMTNDALREEMAKNANPSMERFFSDGVFEKWSDLIEA